MTLRKAEFLSFTEAQSELTPLRQSAADAITAFLAKRQVVVDYMMGQGLTESEALERVPTVPGPPRPRKATNGQPENQEQP